MTRQRSTPRVITRPSSSAGRKRAGTARRPLSSMECSNSPRNSAAGTGVYWDPLRSTFYHLLTTLRPTPPPGIAATRSVSRLQCVHQFPPTFEPNATPAHPCPGQFSHPAIAAASSATRQASSQPSSPAQSSPCQAQRASSSPRAQPPAGRGGTRTPARSPAVRRAAMSPPQAKLLSPAGTVTRRRTARPLRRGTRRARRGETLSPLLGLSVGAVTARPLRRRHAKSPPQAKLFLPFWDCRSTP